MLGGERRRTILTRGDGGEQRGGEGGAHTTAQTLWCGPARGRADKSSVMATRAMGSDDCSERRRSSGRALRRAAAGVAILGLFTTACSSDSTSGSAHNSKKG